MQSLTPSSTGTLRRLFLLFVLIAACRPLVAESEHPIGLIFADQPYVPGAFEIQGETQHVLIVQYGYDEKYRKTNLAKRKLRYLIYRDHAVPFSNGIEQNGIGLERVVEHATTGTALGAAPKRWCPNCLYAILKQDWALSATEKTITGITVDGENLPP